MYTNTGYVPLSYPELEDLTAALRVNCCGVYRLISLPSMSTRRPLGLPDYQLLYVGSGKAFFTIDGQVHEVLQGNMVLYSPRQPQEYCYYLEDSPEIFWIHFTGHEAESLLTQAGFLPYHMLYAGISAKYQELFLSIIREIQLHRAFSQDLTALYLKELLLLVCRQAVEGSGPFPALNKEIEKAVHFFHENFMDDISIDAYAKAHHMSPCWFIRSFKRSMGIPPGQYLTSIRMEKARELLKSTDYTIGEISRLSGYENPLYFSRIFKKYAGTSPAGYRKRQEGG